MMTARPELTYYPLGNRVTAFSSTRQGGYSQGNYGEFNVNAYCGDEPEAVMANRRILCEELGIADNHLVMPHQVHGTGILRITRDFPFSSDPAMHPAALEGVDGLMTDETGLCIGVSTADCIPIIIYDPAHHAAAVVHAGWRGTVQRIAGKAVEAMSQTFGSVPEALQAVIGPGISMANFEVGDEVYGQFADAGFQMKYISRQLPDMRGGSGRKWHIDLWACNFLQLHAAGVAYRNIHEAGICTFESCDEYFSARRLGTASGRILTGIVLR